MKKDLLKTYRNYLYSLEERKRSKDKYGDTEELIKMYEKELKLDKKKTKK